MIYGVPLMWYLMLAAALFCIGGYGVLARRNAIVSLMGVELMLNAVAVNLFAFWRYLNPGDTVGQAFVLFIYLIAVAQVGVGLALLIAAWRAHATIALEDLNQLKG